MSLFIDISPDRKEEYNTVISHPLQSFEWGEFRRKTGVKVVRRGLIENNKLIGGFTLTVHKIPFLPFYAGYLPKGSMPTKEIIDELYRIGKEENCVYVQLEPNVVQAQSAKLNPSASLRAGAQSPAQSSKLKVKSSFHPLFTKYTFVLDLTQSEDELLKAMHPKTRYNIKVAQKHGVGVVEYNSDQAFERYLKLTDETTKRQRFYAHTRRYHELMWETLKIKNSKFEYLNSKQIQNTNYKNSKRLKHSDLKHSNIVSNFGFRASDLNKLTAHLLTALYQNKILVAWVLFVFKDTLYYPYGASSTENREMMASNLMMWEAIRFGKRLGLKKFDMWGALGPNPNASDPWYGFHKFKQGYGGELVEFVGSYDLVINPVLYEMLKIADKARWFLLRLGS